MKQIFLLQEKEGYFKIGLYMKIYFLPPHENFFVFLYKVVRR